MRIAHTADIHLREPHDERWEAFRAVLAKAAEHDAEALAISGDLFDANYDAEQLREKARDLLSNNPFRIVVIPGNHDAKAFGAGYVFGGDVHVIGEPARPVELDEAVVYGLPYEDLEEWQVLEKLRELPAGEQDDGRYRLLLYHGDLADQHFIPEASGAEGVRRYMPARLSYFRESPFDYVLAGHVHSRFDPCELSDGRYFVYPGSPVSLSRTETGPRGLNVFELGSAPERVTLPTKYYQRAAIEVGPEAEAPLDQLQRQLEGLPDHARLLLTVRGFLDRRRMDETEVSLQEKLRQAAGGWLEDPERDFDYGVRDLSEVLGDELYRSFEQRLEQADAERSVKEQALELTAEAMLRVRSGRR